MSFFHSPTPRLAYRKPAGRKLVIEHIRHSRADELKSWLDTQP